MRSIIKVKVVRVPNVEEFNAILFDMQEKQFVILNIELHAIYPDGELCFVVTYNIQHLEEIEGKDMAEDETRNEGEVE
jgi:hypothetical protein|tara:strand:- start:1749 stop:1982 length:234 start_codon:yes stop_codon:yes gene_type:complete